jgi:2-polyprenyl-3-methyl-5-hydroxy-6-metoxy-1,4-benzoquinol methylase
MICRICQSREVHRSYRVRETHFGTGEEFEYFCCADCGCLQIAEIPEDASRYYPEGYYSFRAVAEGSLTARISHSLERRKNRYVVSGVGLLGRLLNAWRPVRNPVALVSRSCPLERSAILDVGCGSGEFLYDLKELGLARAVGIDPFIGADLSYRNGVRVLRTALYEHADASGETYDIVMFNHSFEHMPEPERVLAAARGLTARDGAVLIRVPTVSSFAWERYGADWVGLDAPRHLFLHSLESMEILAKGAGLEVREVVYDSYELQFWGSEQAAKGIPLDSPRSHARSRARSVFSRSEIRAFRRRSEELNREGRGDQAAFLLRRGTDQAD